MTGFVNTLETDEPKDERVERPSEKDAEPPEEGSVLRSSSSGMLLYAVTIFVSAFLLFQVQPIIAKQILPWFGGSAAVWATCMVFFQSALLIGYIYSHWIVQRSPRRQTLIHGALLLLSVLWLPVIPETGWKPLDPSEPIWRILGLLSVTVGLPYVLLSTTGPLLQAWYARRYQSALPYRLFSLSNLASLLGLLAYPFVFEPLLSLSSQAWIWSVAYTTFVLLCGSAAILSLQGRLPGEPAGQAAGAPETSLRPSLGRYLHWITLAAFPSFLLIAVTNQLSEAVASAPFLWVVPLCTYLLTFTICFGRDSATRHALYSRLTAVALVVIGYLFLNPQWIAAPKILIPVFIAGLFVFSMYCHGELARTKPHPRHLTSFYCMVALGGAVGGFLVSIAAPTLLPGAYELVLGLAALSLFALVSGKPSWHRVFLWGVVTVFLVLVAGAHIYSLRNKAVAAGRNFYGSLRITDLPSARAGIDVRMMVHGPIDHGRQFLSDELRGVPTSYYGRQSGIGYVLSVPRTTPSRVGIIGLGAGAMAAYGRPGDTYRFYEINPLVIDMAREYFSFVSGSAAEVEIIPGDARLTLEREPSQAYSVMAIDAFSGDAIPAHLLTLEAIQLYISHLSPTGVLAFHITNKSLDLSAVIERAAKQLGLTTRLVHTPGNIQDETTASTWMIVARDTNHLVWPEIEALSVEPSHHISRAWTDDYSNLLGIVK